MYPTPVDIKNKHTRTPHVHTYKPVHSVGTRPSRCVFAVYVCSVCPNVCECVSRHLRGERVYADSSTGRETTTRVGARESERERERERES